jgi:pectate disaccharide-lyase
VERRLPEGTQYWIAPDGLDTNPGTEAQPFKTLTYAHSRASAGVTIWVKPGTYAWSSTVSLSKSGTESSPINVFAASGARPVFDFSGQPRDTSSARGIQISGSYWHIKGIDVQKAGDNCIHISGSHNTIEWVSVHDCCDSGLQITASTASDQTQAAYNTILNCDSYANYDATTNGENADGFSPKLHIGPGNVFRGCRSWNNADDGFDLFASDDVVVIDHCWAFLNGVLASGGGTSAGDGNGFKLGGAATAGDAYEGGAPHQVSDSFAFENVACGFTRNNNTSVPVLTSCGSRGNGTAYCSLTNSSPVSFTMTGAQAKAVQRNADGSLPAIQ